MLDMARLNSEAIYAVNNAKENINSFEIGRELMKAIVKPNMHTRLPKRCLSKHLQNSITHILEVENNKVEQLSPHDTFKKVKNVCYCISCKRA